MPTTAARPRRLRHDQAFEAYETLNQELLAWVEKGRLLPDAPTPDARVGTPSDTPQERRAKVLAQVELWRDRYGKEFEPMRAPTTRSA